jgi:hypothetical protein
MADVEIKYNNSTIASLNDSGTEVLETNGTFLTDDITIDYTKSGGGGSVTVGVTFSGSASFIQADVPSGSTYENGTAVVPSKSFFVIETDSSCNTLTTGSVSCHLLLYSTRPAVRYVYIVDAGESGGTIRFHGTGGGN